MSERRALNRQRRALLALPVWACCCPIARGTERPGDKAIVAELQKYAFMVTAVQREYLSLSELVAGEARFKLYRTYNQSVGTWLQVEFLRALLHRAVAATSQSDERAIRAELRDQARFTLWELDQNIAHLGEGISGVGQAEFFRLNGVLRSLLEQTRTTVARVSVDRT